MKHLYQLLLISLCCLLSFVSMAQNNYRISIRMDYLPLANYEFYTYEINSTSGKIKMKYLLSEENDRKKTKKRKRINCSKEQVRNFSALLEKALQDSTKVEVNNQVLLDSIFRITPKGRDLVLLSQQLDGPYITLKISSKEGSKYRELMTLDSDMTIYHLMRKESEIKFFTLAKLFEVLDLKDPLVQTYFSQKKQEQLLEQYKKRVSQN